ncbi:hypothetical protein ACFSQ3_06180 [Sphingobacterium corticis]|uniref:Exo-alpha-sialidase n=1 Tax=Sphingobacterium corticis TaxID=1812823 RepID=A0ABW5NL04_9SPHI
MKKILLTVCASIFFASCQKSDDAIGMVDVESQDSVWMKLSIPTDGRGVSAIHGSIDDTLIVATMFNIYITTDIGKSWKKAIDAGLGIAGFSLYDGELMALGSFRGSGDKEFGERPFLFSYNNGDTWSRKGRFTYEHYDTVRVERDRVVHSDGITYRIDNNLKPIAGSTSLLHGPNKLFRVSNDTEEELYFPSKRYFNYLHLDDKNRLYVGADGQRFEGEEEKFVYSASDSSLVYVSRQPVSDVRTK